MVMHPGPMRTCMYCSCSFCSGTAVTNGWQGLLLMLLDPRYSFPGLLGALKAGVRPETRALAALSDGLQASADVSGEGHRVDSAYSSSCCWLGRQHMLELLSAPNWLERVPGACGGRHAGC